MIEAVGGDSGSMGTAFSWEAIVEIPVMFAASGAVLMILGGLAGKKAHTLPGT